jgi:predicted small secreted protein
MFRSMILMLTLAGCVTLAACNTTAGFGRDLQKAGRKIESEAHEHSH